MQRRPIPSVRLCDKRTRAEKVHDVKPVEPLLPEAFEKWRNLVCYESGMARRDVRALNVFLFEPDTEREDALKSAYSIFASVMLEIYAASN
jgi:hypothetical protein